MLHHHRRLLLHFLTPYRLLHPALLVWGFMLRAALGGWFMRGTSSPEALLHGFRNLIIAVWAIINFNMAMDQQGSTLMAVNRLNMGMD